jgi:hypothetical protein
MAENRGFAVIHPDGSVCIASVHSSVVGAIVNWAVAHGDGHFPNIADKETWAFWLRAKDGPHGMSTLSCVAVEPVEGGAVHSLSGVPGNA